MQTAPSDLNTLHHPPTRAPWLVKLFPAGDQQTLTADDMKALDNSPDATAIRIGDMDQGSFEHFITQYGGRFTAIEFRGSHRVTDLTPLGELSRVEMISYRWNIRATSLWDMKRTPNLRALCLMDFSRLTRLDALADATSLTELELGEFVSDRCTYQTLEPLSVLSRLTSLAIPALKVTDGRITPLGSLTALRSLRLPINRFSTEQYAWLRARLPHTTGQCLQPLLHYDEQQLRHGSRWDLRVVGKRKPQLNSVEDAEKVATYVAEWQDMVDRFSRHPDLLPQE